ncbi:MAG: YbaB/EbfC family nucleoid-associated protein [Halobacteriovoraceae bacterium]|nr:YbaB/EbfC family nucleoid-associated protein [Halobacteriovoraceae bacterium]
MGNLIKQAKQMEQKINILKRELASRELNISSGGAIKITINGKQEITDFKIDKSCLDTADTEMLQEMVKTAVNQAVRQSKEMVDNSMKKLTGGMGFPGLF